MQNDPPSIGSELMRRPLHIHVDLEEGLLAISGEQLQRPDVLDQLHSRQAGVELKKVQERRVVKVDKLAESAAGEAQTWMTALP
jgi:hypothetical protein